MIEIADVEASATFSSLLDRATNGEIIVITREGKPVARLEPAETAHDPAAAVESAKRIMRNAQRIHEQSAVSLDEITAWVNQGRP